MNTTADKLAATSAVFIALISFSHAIYINKIATDVNNSKCSSTGTLVNNVSSDLFVFGQFYSFIIVITSFILLALTGCIAGKDLTNLGLTNVDKGIQWICIIMLIITTIGYGRYIDQTQTYDHNLYGWECFTTALEAVLYMYLIFYS